MKEILPNIFAVEVPEDINSIGMGVYAMYGGIPYIAYDTKKSIGWDNRIKLSPGSYTFLFCSNDVTEEQADKIIAFSLNDGGYPDFENTEQGLIYDDALPSFQSLLRSHNITGNQAIIRKN